MVRRIAEQEHSAALAQRASRISANMKFGVDADDDPFVKVEVQTVQTASAAQEQTSCMNLTVLIDRIVAAVLVVLISSPMAARLFCHDAVNSVWQHKQVDRSGQGHVPDSVTVNVRSNDQHLLHCAREETVENGMTRQERQERA